MANLVIAAVSIAGWQGNSSGVSLRIYANDSFTDSGGGIHPQTVVSNLGTASLGTFFQSVKCTVNGSALSIPSITLASTSDSPDNPDATYSAVLWDDASGKQIQQFGTFKSFAVRPGLNPLTWAAIFSAATVTNEAND
jgi:hypothetical protein